MAAEKKILWEKPNSWRLEIEPIVKPDGTVGERACVRHPGAVVLIPLTAAGEVLMLKQYRYSVGQTIWEVPAGTREWDEEWLICAQRELREEAGVRAETFTHLGDIWPAPGISDEMLRLYLARGLAADPLPADFDEEIEVVAVALEDAVVMAYDGRLQDAKSNVAILRTAHYLNND